MESEVTHSADFYKLWAWFEKNKKQVTTGAVVALVLGVIIWFVIWRQGEKTAEAGAALSTVFVPHEILGGGARAETPGLYLKVASDHSGSQAAEQALLLAAGGLFTEGKYAEAQAQFEKFRRDNRGSRLLGPALLGIAASLEAQGKLPEATAAYKDIVEHHSSDPVALQARFGLARLYDAQNKPELALPQYEDVVRNDPMGGSMGNESAMRAEELKAKFPNLAPKPPTPPAASTVTPKAPALVAAPKAPTPSNGAAAPKAPTKLTPEAPQPASTPKR